MFSLNPITFAIFAEFIKKWNYDSKNNFTFSNGSEEV